MSKNLSAKYYQENKERLQKMLVKNIKIFLKKKTKKATIWLWTLQQFFWKWKKKHVEDRKIYYRMRKKCFVIIIRKYFKLENFVSL